MTINIDNVYLSVSGEHSACVNAQVGGTTYRYTNVMSRVDAWKLQDRVLEAMVINSNYWEVV